VRFEIKNIFFYFEKKVAVNYNSGVVCTYVVLNSEVVGLSPGFNGGIILRDIFFFFFYGPPAGEACGQRLGHGSFLRDIQPLGILRLRFVTWQLLTLRLVRGDVGVAPRYRSSRVGRDLGSML
jgi:hypothetical protein